MTTKKYIIKLTPDERQELSSLTQKGKVAVWKFKRALALLKCDQSPDGPAWSDERIADALEITVRSVENWRKQALLQGPLSLLVRKPAQSPPVAPKLDGEAEAKLIAMSCSQPPAGACRWTLRLLAQQLVELNIVDSISHETVRQVLKK